MSTRRYTIDIDDTVDAILTNLTKSRGGTKADIIRRSLATYNFLTTQAPSNSGRKVSITDGEDKVIKDVVLP